MMKQKITGLVLASLLMFGAGSAVCASYLPASAEGTKTSAVNIGEENASLFLPETYEQYLPLQNPSHAAFSDDYIAIADGDLLYLYDRAAGEYSYFEHHKDMEISELQFTESGTLYFTDQSTALYSFDVENRASTRLGISCSTFLIADDSIYFATTLTGTGTVTFYYAPLSSPDVLYSTEIGHYRGGNPHLAYENGLLYCILNDNTYLVYQTAGDEHGILLQNQQLDTNLMQIAGLKYVCAYRNALYYTVGGTKSENGLYRTDVDGNSKRILPCDGLTTLTTYGDGLYCLKGSSLLGVDITDESATFTGYEIASASSSVNRLSGAESIARAGDLLVSADKNNNRVSVYNFRTGDYSVYPVSGALLVATDGETIAASDGETITSFTYPDGQAQTYTVETGRVTGLAVFFSSVYFVTGNNAYGVAGGSDPIFYTSITGTPAGLACDLYGKLYVAYQNGEVYEFEEEDFSLRGIPVKSDVKLPADFTSFRCDFEGNLYCLAGTTLYKNGSAFATVNGNQFVYHAEETEKAPIALAVGFEDDRVFFCFNDYLVASKEGALDIPTLDKIALGTAKEQTFSTGDAQNLLVDVKANSVGIDVGLDQMRTAKTYFPYAGYSRIQQMRGICLAQTEPYSLVLIENDGDYRALLFRTENVTAIDGGEYYTPADEKAYLSNAVNAYYYPCLDETLKQNRFERGAFVTKKCEVALPDRTYALVVYSIGETEYSAFVPSSYLSKSNPTGLNGDRYTLGYLKAEETKFVSAQGEEITVDERTPVRLYLQEDGTYTARYEKSGVLYTASDLAPEDIQGGENDALRTSLIIILSVLAVLIIGLYIFFLPVRKRKR